MHCLIYLSVGEIGKHDIEKDSNVFLNTLTIMQI